MHGIGCGPARRQAEKVMKRRKETKKLQDICRSVLKKEKVQDLLENQNQLAEDRKSRLKQQPLKKEDEDHCRLQKPPLDYSKLKMIYLFDPTILPASTERKSHLNFNLVPSKPRMPVRRFSYLFSPTIYSSILPASKTFLQPREPRGFLKHQQFKFFFSSRNDASLL